MIGYSSLNTYFDEDALPPGQEPILTESLEKVRTQVEFLLDAKQKTGYSMMGVITGPPGVGKSIALQTVLDDIMKNDHGGLPSCLKIKAKPGSSPRQLVDDLLGGFGEKPRHPSTNRFQLVDQAAEATFNNDLKLLAIDDAEQLDELCYDFLRFHFAKTGCATLVIGLPPIVRMIKKHDKFSGRLHQELDFSGPSEKEVLDTILPNLMIPHWTFDPHSEQDQILGKQLWASVKPSFRNLRGVLQNASLLADLQVDKRITHSLVVQGFHLTPMQRRPGGLDEPKEQEAQPEPPTEQEPQTEYEEDSVARQQAKAKKPEDE